MLHNSKWYESYSRKAVNSLPASGPNILYELIVFFKCCWFFSFIRIDFFYLFMNCLLLFVVRCCIWMVTSLEESFCLLTLMNLFRYRPMLRNNAWLFTDSFCKTAFCHTFWTDTSRQKVYAVEFSFNVKSNCGIWYFCLWKKLNIKNSMFSNYTSLKKGSG